MWHGGAEAGETERVVIEVACVMMEWRCGVVVQTSANFRVPVPVPGRN